MCNIYKHLNLKRLHALNPKNCIIKDRFESNLGIAPHKHCGDVLLTKFPSKSRGVLSTTFLVKPTIYLTNLEDLRIEAIVFLPLQMRTRGSQEPQPTTY